MRLEQLVLELEREANMGPIYDKIREGAMESDTVDFRGENGLNSRQVEVLRKNGYVVSYNRFSEVWTVGGWASGV